MTKDEIVEMAREAGASPDGKIWLMYAEELEVFYKLAAAKERESFFGQDKPAKCAEGCLPNQICDYCQIVAPVREMIAAEREACAKVLEAISNAPDMQAYAKAIREREQA